MKKKKLNAVIILYIVYRICLDVIYINWQNPIYEYLNFPLDITLSKIFISYLILFILVALIPKTEKKVSYLVLQLHLIVMIIPLTSIYALAGLPTSFMLMISSVFLLQIVLIRILPNFNLINVKKVKKITLLIILLILSSTYGYLLLTQNINFGALTFLNIYEIREELDLPFPITYFLIWTFRIINPILFVYFYINKNKRLMIVVAVAQILLYLMYPHKEVFFSIIYLLLILFLYKKKIQFSSFFVLLLTLTIVITATFYKISTFLLYPYAVIPSRLLFVPAKIKFEHYDFFSQNDKLYYSEGLIGSLLGLEYPYQLSSGYVVGLYNGFDSNSNTGYLAYAYDNAGFLGMILMSLLLVFILKLFDSQSKNFEPKLIFAFLAYPMLILNDGDILTLILTGGVFLIVLFMFTLNDFIGGKEDV